MRRGRIDRKQIKKDATKGYPVYSASTRNNGLFGYSDHYTYDGEFLTCTAGGYAGNWFYRNEKFDITGDTILLKLLKKDINIKFLLFLLNQETKKYLNTHQINKKLNISTIEEIELYLPLKEEQDRIANLLEPMSESKDGIIGLLNQEINLLDKKIKYYKNKLLHI